MATVDILCSDHLEPLGAATLAFKLDFETQNIENITNKLIGNNVYSLQLVILDISPESAYDFFLSPN